MMIFLARYQNSVAEQLPLKQGLKQRYEKGVKTLIACRRATSIKTRIETQFKVSYESFCFGRRATFIKTRIETHMMMSDKIDTKKEDHSK